MKCKRCDGKGSIAVHHKATHMDPPENVLVDCPENCVECHKCGNFVDKVEDLDWCVDCHDNYDGPDDDYYSDYYGGGQATQEQRYQEAAAEKRKLG